MICLAIIVNMIGLYYVSYMIVNAIRNASDYRYTASDVYNVMIDSLYVDTFDNWRRLVYRRYSIVWTDEDVEYVVTTLRKNEKARKVLKKGLNRLK